MKILKAIFGITTLLYFVGCNGIGVHGSGIIKDEYRDVESFDGIEVSGFYDIHIQCGEKPGLKIIGDDNILPLIKTNIENGTLHIWNKKNISPRKKIRFEITTDNISSLNSSGANRIIVQNINNDELEVEVSGAGTTKLEGKTEYLNINLSGAANIKADKLKAKKVTVEISGASSADVYASEELRAEISGVGNINYYGNPQDVKKSISGLGSINQK
ncbi:MAG: DUF2807 domain-containing protein [Ignavibacteriales bacterium]|nr:DUF2807 domain-containing protein [Ignavibacteriales bacterium]